MHLPLHFGSSSSLNNLVPVLSSAAASVAAKFTMTIASLATTASTAHPISIVALICCCQLLFAASVYVMLTRKNDPTVIHLHMATTPVAQEVPVTQEVPVAQETQEAQQTQEIPVAQVSLEEQDVPFPTEYQNYTIQVPKQPRKHRNLKDYLQDGQRVRHTNKTHGTLYARYNVTYNSIICDDGAKFKNPSGFAKYHLRSLFPENPKRTADGWTECQTEVDGKWVKMKTLTPLV
jgi:hypothetical protein